MRLSGIALCTLSAIATSGLSAQAAETSGEVPTPIKSEGGPVVSESQPVVISAQAIQSVAAPETAVAINQPSLAQPVFSTVALQPESSQPLPQQSTQSLSPSSPASVSQLSGQNSGNASALASATLVRSQATDSAPIQFGVNSTVKLVAIAPESIQSAPTVNLTTADASTAASTNPSTRASTTVASLTGTDEATQEQLNSPQAGQAKTPQGVAATPASNAAPCVKLAQATEGQQEGQQRGQQCPRPEAVQPLVVPEVVSQESSPALSIYIPVGYGADKNTVWLSADYQSDVRVNNFDAASFGVGVGLGDADKALGVELSYAFANNARFGEGGFNAKLHHRFPGDVGVAVGWNGFLNIGRNDFEQSLYGVATKVFRLRDSVNDPFSRLAVTIGVGNNQFRSGGAVDAGENNVNVFGNLALRVARPVSLIAEWTGQDLALGLSIALFRKFPLVITPAVRDVVSDNGYSPRFVLGAGMAFNF